MIMEQYLLKLFYIVSVVILLKQVDTTGHHLYKMYSIATNSKTRYTQIQLEDPNMKWTWFFKKAFEQSYSWFGAFHPPRDLNLPVVSGWSWGAKTGDVEKGWFINGKRCKRRSELMQWLDEWEENGTFRRGGWSREKAVNEPGIVSLLQVQ